MKTRETKPVATSSLGYEYPRLGLYNVNVTTGVNPARRVCMVQYKLGPVHGASG